MSPAASALLATHAARRELEPAHVPGNGSHGDGGVDECAVCMATVRAPVKLACGHRYCEVCIESWLRHSRTCPLCRQVVYSPSQVKMLKWSELFGTIGLSDVAISGALIFILEPQTRELSMTMACFVGGMCITVMAMWAEALAAESLVT